MELLIPMVLGLFVARLFSSDKVKKVVDKLQVVTTLILIFSMGYSPSRRENFISELSEMGVLVLLYALVPVLFSIALVYITTTIYLKRKGRK